MNRGKAKLICKIYPLLECRYGLEYHPPEFHPAVTTELPEFFISLQRKKTTGCAGMLPNSFSFKFTKSKPHAMLCLVRQPT